MDKYRRRNTNGLSVAQQLLMLDIYVTFLIEAIGGYPGHADALYRRYSNEIDTIASFFQYHARSDPSGTLYRGLLLLPGQVPANRRLTGSDYQKATFTSFTGNLEVACMFANTESFISSGVAKSRPGVEGWIGEHSVTSDNKILFSYTWLPFMDTASLRREIRELAIIGQQSLNPLLPDPEALWNQINHSLDHQQEVILKSDVTYPIKSITDYSCLSAIELDRRYRYIPPYIAFKDPLTHRLRHFPITNIEWNDPPLRCPQCGQNGIRMILVSSNLRWIGCDACEMNWPDIFP